MSNNVSNPVPLEELEFGGGPNEDVSKFLGAVKRVALTQGRHLDHEWVIEYIESCLRGDALDWFDEMDPDEVAAMDWRSLRKAFLGRFRGAPPATPTAEPTATPTAVPAATTATDAKANAAKRAKSDVEDAAETEPGASVTAGKKATGIVAKKGTAPMDMAMATEAAATAEAATRAATAAAKRAATAAATATKAATAVAEAMAEAKAAVAEMKAAAGTGTAAARKHEVPKAPLPSTISDMFSGTKATWVSKILLLGNSGVGKSCLLSRHLGYRWDPSATPTAGIHHEININLLQPKGSTISLNKVVFWDASGLEECRNTVGPYCLGMTRIWIVYDVTDQKSFQDVRQWFDLVMQHNPGGKEVLRLIGNKCDLHDRRVIQEQQGRNLANELKIPQFFETSARTNDGVREMSNKFLNLLAQSN
ncbi:GTP-binding protein [Tulasnella sp. JGI-2019a]|nr:GTP-binding protein [Tulasnella sp. JGI-2019a]